MQLLNEVVGQTEPQREGSWKELELPSGREGVDYWLNSLPFPASAPHLCPPQAGLLLFPRTFLKNAVPNLPYLTSLKLRRDTSSTRKSSLTLQLEEDGLLWVPQ